MLTLLLGCFADFSEPERDREDARGGDVDFDVEVTHFRNGLDLKATGGSPGTPDVPDNPFEGEEFFSLYNGDEELCRLSWRAEATWDPTDANGPELQYENACWEPVFRGDVDLCRSVYGQPPQMVTWPLGVERLDDQTAVFSSHDGAEWLPVAEGTFDGTELSYAYDEDYW
jgi:hypothetical protein